MGLINAKAFQVLMHLCNSIQFILDSTKTPDSEVSTETRKKLEVILSFFIIIINIIIIIIIIIIMIMIIVIFFFF